MPSIAIGARTARIKRGLKHWRRAPELIACAAQIREWRQVALGYLGVSVPTFPFTVHFRNGDRVLVETFHDLVTVWVIFFRNEYHVAADSTTIVDAGANIGTFVLYAARKAPGSIIHALEPFPTTRERLLETLRSNGLEKRVTVYSVGLSGVDSTRFMDGGGPSQSRGTTVSGDGIAVETQTLANFLDHAGVARADLLKMDIEGAEHEVFAAASTETLKRFRQIALEYHPNGSSRTLFAKLQSAGFVCDHDERSTPDSEDSGVAHFVRQN